MTECGKGIGSGHLARCLALSQGFMERGFEVSFVVNAVEPASGIPGGVKVFRCAWHVPEGQRAALDLVRGADLLVVDSYLAPQPCYAALAGAAKRMVCLDDNARVEYPRGWVVNGGVDAGMLDYRRCSGVHYLLGPEFTALRRSFWDIRPRAVSPEVRRVLVTFGGVDSRQMAPRVARHLQEAFPAWGIDVVNGCSSEAQMCSLMRQADMAVSSAGQTLYELACCGVAAVGVCVAGNQRLNVQGWTQAGYLEYAGGADDPDILENILKNVRRLLPYEVREARAAAGQGKVDGQGVRRIVAEVLKGL